MRILLDTHIFLWYIKKDRRLSKSIESKITHATEAYVSAASIWELVIKIQLKKMEGDIGQIIETIAESGFTELPITTYHAAAVLKLDPIHRDPFDRMLIAQAISEPLTLITADAKLRPYSHLIELVD